MWMRMPNNNIWEGEEEEDEIVILPTNILSVSHLINNFINLQYFGTYFNLFVYKMMWSTKW